MTETPHLDTEALAELQEVMEDEFDVLIQTFLSDSEGRIQALWQALESSDEESFRKSAHSFKGSCINIGAPRLGEHCFYAEQAARAGRLQDAGDSLRAIESEFEAVTDALNELLQR
ncbi:HPt (histidine-containing phosphotransfer) domain-containing protein [Tamilnaduibacter salinus]|uniref:HPt (Histidine-containing phosphotransfer) domain-containing protein n=1 Tax=Tamilnaduibacter salinus TaxID=1484056 RepID=A0A2U1D1I7_9GAMM|nr:Hpt domain-containing protein [Tamilnaduibacter salinus]PVY79253.1 HPt (histidine-containing phosphotransfer) domain-containing protein [Tamilnaduibacter salinus]